MDIERIKDEVLNRVTFEQNWLKQRVSTSENDNLVDVTISFAAIKKELNKAFKAIEKELEQNLENVKPKVDEACEGLGDACKKLVNHCNSYADSCNDCPFDNFPEGCAIGIPNCWTNYDIEEDK